MEFKNKRSCLYVQDRLLAMDTASARGEQRYSRTDVLHQSSTHLINAVIHRSVVQASGGGVTFWVTCFDDVCQLSASLRHARFPLRLSGPLRRPYPV